MTLHSLSKFPFIFFQESACVLGHTSTYESRNFVEKGILEQQIWMKVEHIDNGQVGHHSTGHYIHR